MGTVLKMSLCGIIFALEGLINYGDGELYVKQIKDMAILDCGKKELHKR